LVANNRYSVLMCWDESIYFWEGNIVFTYETLLSYGYNKNDIDVFNEDNSPPSKSEYYDFIISEAQLDIEFSSINSKSTSDDFIFIFACDHGDRDNDYMKSFVSFPSEDYYDDEFASDVSSISNYKYMSILVQFCFSGGFIDDLSATNRQILASAPYCYGSYGDISMSAFSKPFMGALRSMDIAENSINADTSYYGTDDGVVSMVEAYNYAYGADSLDYVLYDDNGIALDEEDLRNCDGRHGYPSAEPYYLNSFGEAHYGENLYYWDHEYQDQYGSLSGNHIDGPGYHGSTKDAYNTWDEGELGKILFL
jgi:hypothetical protein